MDDSSSNADTPAAGGEESPTITTRLRSIWRFVHDRVLRKYIKRVN
jgi:hypothetical protein